MPVKQKISWNQIWLIWGSHYVSTREFCRTVKIDRTQVQERIRDQRRKPGKIPTIAEQQKQLDALRANGEHDKADELAFEVYVRIREWDLAARMIRMLAYEANGQLL